MGNVKKEMQDRSGLLEMVFSVLFKIYLVLLLGAAPLYYNYGYQDIAHAKWNFYRNISLFVRLRAGEHAYYLPSFLPVILCLILLRKIIRKEKIHLSVTDMFVLGFGGAVILSALLAPDKTGILYGISGWYMGVFAQLSFVMLYFCASRCFREDRIVSVLILISSSAVIFVAVLNAFKIYPLSITNGSSEYARALFMSTLGQPDWYSAWLMQFMAVGMYFFRETESRAMKITAAVYLMLCTVSCVTQNADTAIMVLGILIMLAAAFSFDSRKHLLGFLDMSVLILASMRFTGLIVDLIPQHVHKLEPLMVSVSHSRMIIPALIILSGLRIFLSRKNINDVLKEKGTGIRRCILSAYQFFLVCFLIYFVLNSLDVLPVWMQSKNTYLRFNDAWGNYRGFLYRITVASVIMCMQSDPVRFLVGYGPDKYYRLVYQYYYSDIQRVYEGKRLVCAHNEFLNMAVNTGITGAVSYLGIFVSLAVRALKKYDQDPAVMMGILAVAAYVSHGMLNFQQIISAPVIFALMGITENRLRRIS